MRHFSPILLITSLPAGLKNFVAHGDKVIKKKCRTSVRSFPTCFHVKAMEVVSGVIKTLL